MRYQILFPTVVLIMSSAFGQQNSAVPLKSHSDSVSYIIGRDVGEQIKEFGAQMNLPPFQMGVQQALKGTKSPIDSSTADSLRSSFASEVRENMQQQQQAQADSNKKASDEFLTQNKNRRGYKGHKERFAVQGTEKRNRPQNRVLTIQSRSSTKACYWTVQ